MLPICLLVTLHSFKELSENSELLKNTKWVYELVTTSIKSEVMVDCFFCRS